MTSCLLLWLVTSFFVLWWWGCNTLICGQLLMWVKWVTLICHHLVERLGALWTSLVAFNFCSVLLMITKFLPFLQPTTCCSLLAATANNDAGNDVDATGLFFQIVNPQRTPPKATIFTATQVLMLCGQLPYIAMAMCSLKKNKNNYNQLGAQRKNIKIILGWCCGVGLADVNLHHDISYYLSNTQQGGRMGTEENPIWYCLKFTRYLGNTSQMDKAVTCLTTESIA